MPDFKVSDSALRLMDHLDVSDSVNPLPEPNPEAHRSKLNPFFSAAVPNTKLQYNREDLLDNRTRNGLNMIQNKRFLHGQFGTA